MTLSQEHFISKCIIKHKSYYDYSLTIYSGLNKIIKIKCPKHDIFEQNASSHIEGRGCPRCAGNLKLNTDSFTIKASEKHNNKYNYSMVNYINSKIKVSIICLIHGEFSQTPAAHLRGDGCAKCTNTKRLTLQEFIEKANIVHNFKYDYDKVNYINNRVKVYITCLIHGAFLQKPNAHLNGLGCLDCSGTKKIPLNITNFISAASAIHKNKYNYSLSIIRNRCSKVKILCPIHGDFYQIAREHLIGIGCDGCGGTKTLTNEIFVNRANILHNYKYNYELINYINGKTKIIIICPRHGKFEQKPNDHLSGKGCRKCSSNSSKMEILWLKYLNIPEAFYQKSIKLNGKTFFLDAYNKDTNTIYEFYGDYWHGNPKVFNPNDLNKVCKKNFSVLYDKTMKRESFLKSMGFTIISIWENDWKSINNKI